MIGTIIGFIGVVLVVGSWMIPSTKNLCIAHALGACCVLTYGITLGSPVIIAQQIATIAFISFRLYSRYHHTHDR